jgi:hypothetical protein
MAALVATLGFAGCGSGDDGNTAAFTGTWQYSSGTRMTTCQGLGAATEPLMGTLIVAKGVDAPLVVLVNNGTCQLKLDPAGTSATLRMAQICPAFQGQFSDGTGYTETDTHNTGSFVINGRTAVISESGSGTIVGGGQTFVCTFTMNGTLNKITQ